MQRKHKATCGCGIKNYYRNVIGTITLEHHWSTTQNEFRLLWLNAILEHASEYQRRSKSIIESLHCSSALYKWQCQGNGVMNTYTWNCTNRTMQWEQCTVELIAFPASSCHLRKGEIEMKLWNMYWSRSIDANWKRTTYVHEARHSQRTRTNSSAQMKKTFVRWNVKKQTISQLNLEQLRR